jgi:hypothetical protein
MREVTRQTGSPSDEHYRHVTLTYLNTLLGVTAKSVEYWKLLQSEIQVKFPGILSESEKNQNLFELLKAEIYSLFKVFIQMTAIQISSDALEYEKKMRIVVTVI